MTDASDNGPEVFEAYVPLSDTVRGQGISDPGRRISPLTFFICVRGARHQIHLVAGTLRRNGSCQASW